MQKSLPYFLLCLAVCSGQLAFAADVALNPKDMSLKVYKMAVSTSPLCTNLKTIFTSSTPTYTDFLAGPNLGSGEIADGTYPCVVIEFSDQVKFHPAVDSTSGNCLAAVEYQLDVCRNPDSSQLIDGTSVTCGAGDDRVAMFISTAATGPMATVSPFNPPTTDPDTSNGFNLSNALVIAGISSGKFVADGTGTICDSNDVACAGGGGTTCEMEAPIFGFSQI